MYSTLHCPVCWHSPMVLYFQTFAALIWAVHLFLEGTGPTTRRRQQSCTPGVRASHSDCTFQRHQRAWSHRLSPTLSRMQNTTKGQESGRQEHASKTHSARDTQLSVFLSKSSKNNLQSGYYHPILTAQETGDCPGAKVSQETVSERRAK